MLPLVIGLVLVAMVLVGIGAIVTTSDDDSAETSDQGIGSDRDSAPGGAAEMPGDSSDDVDDSSDDDLDVPDPPVGQTPTSYEPEPAQAGVHDCIAVDSGGYFVSTGSCQVGGAPYRVVEVIERSQTCSNPDNSFTPSGDYTLCLELNLIYNYCYVFPAGPDGSIDGWIQGSECELPGTVHVIDVVLGGVHGDECTDDYHWELWYSFFSPPMVVCVDQF